MCVCVYMYLCVYVCMCVYTCMYITHEKMKAKFIYIYENKLIFQII